MLAVNHTIGSDTIEADNSEFISRPIRLGHGMAMMRFVSPNI